MSPIVVGIICIILMFVLMFSRVPIAISMAVPGILGAVYLRGMDAVGSMLNTVVWDQSASYIFSTIPLFVLMGELLFAANITKDLFDSFRKWFGGLRGGLGIATIGASSIFAASSGSSIAATGTMGLIATNEMRESNYKDSFAGGTVVAGGTLGVLIPPSTAFIIYGLMADQSIGQLLIAGIIPGVMLTIIYMGIVFLSVTINPSLAPRSDLKFTWKEKFASLKSTIWFIALFVLVIGGMYIGIFSPTESAGIGAAGALTLCLIRGGLTFEKVVTAFSRTLKTTSFMFAIILGAYILNYFLALTRLPIMLAEWITNSGISMYGFLFLIIILYILLGMVMDLVAVMVITMPVFLPTLIAFDFDLIWFGVIVVILIEMAMITPPVGINCFVLKGAVPDLHLGDIFNGAIRFVIGLAILLVLMILFPQIPLFLPGFLM
ncbi:TRAP transporter large permease [Oceanobacillus longus]|uniref:TRAP transporter large permease n=1 Tax=Oceanobacillus longus TaxID=930120 RepID=A0ABV8H388_9BACI